MKKETVQEWIDVVEKIDKWFWSDNLDPLESSVLNIFEDPAFNQLKMYLIKNANSLSKSWHKEINLARKLVKMPDEQWDLFVLSGFKYYKRKK